MKVLIVDDEKNMRASLTQFLAMEEIETSEAQNGLAAQRLLQEEQFDAAVVDLKMPGMDGLHLLRWVKAEGPDIPVIMMSAFGEVEDAVTAMKGGAADYLVKPFGPEELLIRLERAVSDSTLARQAAPHEQEGSLVESRNAAMREVYRILGKVAPSESTVLLTCESGTGKEIVARHIHDLSPRKPQAFVPINVGGLPESLLESELFGYEKGAFTGADHRKLGMFEMAQGGTLFLDEIGDMPLHLQVKLLRVLQDRKIQRLGSTGVIPISVRLIAATNRDIEERVRQGAFREDLYYRLNVIRVKLPPLRERQEDIPLFVGYFLKETQKRTGSKVSSVTSDAMARLARYRFPGNIRELENMVERAVILCDGTELSARDFGLAGEGESSPIVPPEGSLREMGKLVITRALLRHEGRRQETAQELGITRRTLLNKINKYKIST